MKVLKKLSTIVVALVCAVFVCSVSVSAVNMEESAESISAGKTYSGKVDNGKVNNYKIKVNSKGEMKITFTSYIKNMYIFVYNSDFELLAPDAKLSSGQWFSSNYSIDYDKNTEVAKGTETFDVKPGTYYIQIKGQHDYNTGNFKFSVKTPGSNSETSVSSSSSSASIKLCMEVGDKIDLSAMNEGKEISSASWSSSNSKIAKVSTKGKITALKAGSCTITWKSGSAKFVVYVDVE